MDTKALRQKILDLAIRGKLVPQDPDDEPASVLLEKIREQKQQMFKEGKLKKKDIKNDSIIFKGEDNLHYEKFQDGTVKCIEDEIPFELPEGWAWERLGNVSTIARGGSPRPIEDFLTDDKNGINWIKIGDTEKDGKYILHTKEKIKAAGLSKTRYVQSGDFLLTNSMSFGRPYILKTDGCIHDGWLVIGNIKTVFSQDYLYYALSSGFMYTTLSLLAAGSTVKNLKSDTVRSVLFPIPPLDEQERLACRLEELISFVDSINADEDKLVRIIEQTKSKILDLAIRGKLVPQDPNDKPASVLLERIRAEKEELIKQGKIKRDKKESVIFKGEDNSYYGIHLPDGWDWASLREIALSISDGSHNPPPDNGSGIPLLSAANINDNSILMNEISRWITNEEWKIENQRTNIEVGDVLLTIVGSIGRSAVVQNSNHFALQRSVAVIKPCLINPLYLMHIVQSPQIQKWLTDNSKGTAQKGIYLNALSLMIIPIPPLAEQARIVEKIHIAYKQLDLISNALL